MALQDLLEMSSRIETKKQGLSEERIKAQLPIISFGHSLVHGVVLRANSDGILGVFTGMFDLTAGGIVAAIVFSFIFTILSKPQD